MRDHWSNDKGGESFNRSWFLRKGFFASFRILAKNITDIDVV